MFIGAGIEGDLGETVRKYMTLTDADVFTEFQIGTNISYLKI
ncbi:hypothetical protein ALO_07293 [Acetonema longum DSM 6540]|uniref:Uncharacterized protein n=1 Tax=Acetonema longum DSM 6540 TaxID=1009370 RepID=F7NHB3_9FIRM|nr:hypothetical protein ALO_07293 [Acetonema longum DSM 6540]